MSEAIVAPKPKLGRPPKVRPSTEPLTHPSPPPPAASNEQSLSHLQWRVTTLTREVERLQRLLEEERQRAGHLADALHGQYNVENNGKAAYETLKEAARAIAADALAYVRPHAAGDLWNRWVAQWPWLPGSERDAGEPTAE